MGKFVAAAVALVVAAAMLLGSMASSVIGAGTTTSTALLGVVAASNEIEGQGDALGTCGLAPGQNDAGAAVAAAAARAAGFVGGDLLTAVAVAGAESGWNPKATNHNTDGSTDFGMWQINSVHAALLAGGDWSDPFSNARMARQVFLDAGGSWSPWVTFQTGAYRTKIPAALAALGSGKGLPPTTCTVPPGTPGSGEGHLTTATVAMKRAVQAQFPGLTVGCYRTLEDGGEHPRGRACDVMVYTDKAKGDAIASWAQGHAGALHLKYAIWYQHIWSPARAGEGWRSMADRGGVTANHEDHVHLSVECSPGDGAKFPWSGCA